MPPAPAARAKVLQAFAAILVEHGERAATLDAVAARAGVSKGGLLYHFGSKEALVEGLVGHLRELTAADVAAMRAAPAGPADYLLRTSLETDGDFELVYVGVTRLAQGAYPHARAALDDAHDAWHDALAEAVGDPAVTRALVLLSDGLYARASLGTGGPRLGPDDVDELLGLVDQLLAARRAG